MKRIEKIKNFFNRAALAGLMAGGLVVCCDQGSRVVKNLQKSSDLAAGIAAQGESSSSVKEKVQNPGYLVTEKDAFILRSAEEADRLRNKAESGVCLVAIGLSALFLPIASGTAREVFRKRKPAPQA